MTLTSSFVRRFENLQTKSQQSARVRGPPAVGVVRTSFTLSQVKPSPPLTGIRILLLNSRAEEKYGS